MDQEGLVIHIAEQQEGGIDLEIRKLQILLQPQHWVHD
jgi:hypothetical protein